MSTRKNLALREAFLLDAQALVLLSKQFKSILGCTPTLGKTVDQVNSHLHNTNQRIVVLSESNKSVNRIKESLLLGYCLSELVEMPGELPGNMVSRCGTFSLRRSTGPGSSPRFYLSRH